MSQHEKIRLPASLWGQAGAPGGVIRAKGRNICRHQSLKKADTIRPADTDYGSVRQSGAMGYALYWGGHGALLSVRLGIVR
ncbi:hypothetical protein AA0475_2185 [Acetobacter peroxydans]|nr:hypothetical protein AA0475_2185 [Acetobacter peroxydans]